MASKAFLLLLCVAAHAEVRQVHEPQFEWHGGPILASVRVYQVLYGTGTFLPEVARTSAPSIATLFEQLLTQTTLISELQQYNLPTQAFTGGSFVEQIQIEPSEANSGSALSFEQVQTELAAQITAGALPSPTTDDNGNPTVYYAVFFPEEVAVVISSSLGGTICGYHSFLPVGSSLAVYGVHINGGICGDFDFISRSTTHELIEAATDPFITTWMTSGLNNELCDGCQITATLNACDGHTYTTNMFWSDAAASCVAVQPVCSTVSVSPSVTASPGPNLLVNPGFEQSPPLTGWTSVGHTTYITNSRLAHSGSRASIVDSACPEVSEIVQAVATVPGASYLVSFWANYRVIGNPFIGSVALSATFGTNSVVALTSDSPDVNELAGVWLFYQKVIEVNTSSSALVFNGCYAPSSAWSSFSSNTPAWFIDDCSVAEEQTSSATASGSSTPTATPSPLTPEDLRPSQSPILPCGDATVATVLSGSSTTLQCQLSLSGDGESIPAIDVGSAGAVAASTGDVTIGTLSLLGILQLAEGATVHVSGDAILNGAIVFGNMAVIDVVGAMSIEGLDVTALIVPGTVLHEGDTILFLTYNVAANPSTSAFVFGGVDVFTDSPVTRGHAMSSDAASPHGRSATAAGVMPSIVCGSGSCSIVGRAVPSNTRTSTSTTTPTSSSSIIVSPSAASATHSSTSTGNAVPVGVGVGVGVGVPVIIALILIGWFCAKKATIADKSPLTGTPSPAQSPLTASDSAGEHAYYYYSYASGYSPYPSESYASSPSYDSYGEYSTSGGYEYSSGGYEYSSGGYEYSSGGYEYSA